MKKRTLVMLGFADSHHFFFFDMIFFANERHLCSFFLEHTKPIFSLSLSILHRSNAVVNHEQCVVGSLLTLTSFVLGVSFSISLIVSCHACMVMIQKLLKKLF
jgi:hypothetical protein